MRKWLFLVAIALSISFESVLSAAIFTYGFSPATITTTAAFYSIDTTGASGRARAFYVTGDWSVAGGDPWSNEFRVQITGLTNLGGGGLQRAMGGLGNGSAYTFGAPAASTWSNNTTSPTGMGAVTYLADVAAADLGGIYSVGLRQTFGGSSANLANAAVHFATDVITPVAVNTIGGPSMSRRPSSLTGLSSAGTYRYQTLSYTATASGAHHFGLYTGGADGYLFVYNGAFNPLSPLTNLVGLDDIGDLGDANSSSMWLNMNAGDTYTMVASVFSSGADVSNGTFTIAGPVGAVIPEPATMGLLATLSMGGLAFRRIRKKS